MGKTFKFLKFIDLLVTPYDFNVNNNEKSMTVTGGCLSLFIILLMIVYTINFYVKQITASASIYTGTGAQGEELINKSLNQENMGFVLQLTEKQGGIISFMDELNQYLTIEATLIEQSRTQGVYGFKRSQTSLKLERCEQEFLEQFNFKSVSFTQEQLDNFICFRGEFRIDGQFYDPEFTYVEIDIAKCQGDNCKSEQEIINFIDKGYVVYYDLVWMLICLLRIIILNKNMIQLILQKYFLQMYSGDLVRVWVIVKIFLFLQLLLIKFSTRIFHLMVLLLIIDYTHHLRQQDQKEDRFLLI